MNALIFYILLFSATNVVAYFFDMTETLSGEPLTNITVCNTNRPLKPHNIHVVISVTAGKHAEKAKLYTETVQYYSMLHGYHFQVIDPTDLLVKYGREFSPYFKSMKLSGAVLNLKGLISLCKILLLFSSNCSVINFSSNLQIASKRFSTSLAVKLDGCLYWMLT
jgi:hypothetical protein